MSGDAPPPIADPPDPRAAADVAEFVELLRRLRRQAGNPGYKKTLERATRDGHGVPRLSGSTMHRVLECRQDLTRVRDPELFVREFVGALGADPAPWLEALDRLLRPVREPDREAPPVTAPGGGRGRRRALVAAVAVLLVAAGVVAWSTAGPGDPPAAPVTGPTRLAVVLAADGDLRLTVDRTPDQSVAYAVLSADADATPWEVVARNPTNPGYWQLRPAGRLLACLEVLGGSVDDGALVQQYGCNGERHQYWEPRPQPDGASWWVNLHSDQCLTVDTRPRAGATMVQRPCDPARAEAQRWRTSALEEQAAPGEPATVLNEPAALPSSTTPGPEGVPDQDPAERPGGGEDRPCPGLGDGLDPDATAWSGDPWPVHGEPGAANRGRVSLGPGKFGEVELVRADTVAGRTYYWARGRVAFSPDRFTMALQWTTDPGGAGWHSCTRTFAGEHRDTATAALPRDVDGVDVSFRICLTYAPELAPRDPVVHCAGRH
ncbi:RICIN domain-containing protein [Saccharothrix xinjiangensis]|uniref:RICIN domain-containing protein n=1 Tax=Saccharothrix xinjiangensis TaxID=204798 RepID=A0ABV9YBX5_9PSEU